MFDEPSVSCGLIDTTKERLMLQFLIAKSDQRLDADSRLYKKSKQSPAILCYQGHILMENRSGLVVGAVVSHADGFAERANALRLIQRPAAGKHVKWRAAKRAESGRIRYTPPEALK